jgi:hypothetical protein
MTHKTEIESYANESLNIVKSSDFLSKTDWEAMASMESELQDTFEKKKLWRTETEMNISVLNDIKYPDNGSKYWQCMKEQAVFFENLVTLSFDYRRNLIKIARIEKKIKDILDTQDDPDNLDVEELKIDLEEAKFTKKNMELSAKDRVREIKMWSDKKEELNNGTFDTDDINTHQLVSYTKRFIGQFIQSAGSGSPSERVNLEGQLITALRACDEKNIIHEVTGDLQNNAQQVVNDILKQLDITH